MSKLKWRSSDHRVFRYGSVGKYREDAFMKRVQRNAKRAEKRGKVLRYDEVAQRLLAR